MRKGGPKARPSRARVTDTRGASPIRHPEAAAEGSQGGAGSPRPASVPLLAEEVDKRAERRGLSGEVPRRSKNEKALAAALRFLAYRPRAEAEIRKRLARAFPAPVVDATLNRLRTLGHLDDAAFARWWRDQRDRNKPKGAVAIRRELRRLGVAPGTIEEALAGLDEDAAAIAAGERQASKLHDLAQRPFLERLIPYLRRRGFALSVARRAAYALWETRAK